MSSPDRPERNTAVFTIQAAADPGVLPQAVGLFAKHGLIPSRWVGNAHAADSRLFLTFEVDGMADVEAHRMANGLRRILCVETVVTDSRALSARRA
jgi:hypothetical protein